jgi:hypothetical protein
MLVMGSAGASESWPLPPDFCACDERSRNIDDTKGLENLCRGFRLPSCLARRQSLGRAPVARQRGSNEAAMFMIAQHLNIYLRNSAGAGPEVLSRPAGDPARRRIDLALRS